MELFTKDEIKNADDAVYEEVPVPEWGPNKGVRLKSLTGTQRDEFEAKSLIQKGANQKLNLTNMRSRLLVMVIVDGNGNRMFADSDVHSFGRKNAGVIDKLFTVAQKMNGMTDEDIEELSEGFEEDPSADSTSV